MKVFFELLIKHFHFLIILNMALKVYQSFDVHRSEVESYIQQGKMIEQKVKIAKKKNKEATEFVKNLEASKARVKEVALQIEKVQKQLPNELADTEILDFFSKEASLMNIKDIFLAPMDEELRGFYFAKKYQFKGVGTFLQFLIFFEKIALSERILNVRSLKLEHINERVRGRFQVLTLEATMEAFRHNQNYKEETGIETIEKEFQEKSGKKRKPKRDLANNAGSEAELKNENEKDKAKEKADGE